MAGARKEGRMSHERPGCRERLIINSGRWEAAARFWASPALSCLYFKGTVLAVVWKTGWGGGGERMRAGNSEALLSVDNMQEGVSPVQERRKRPPLPHS